MPLQQVDTNRRTPSAQSRKRDSISSDFSQSNKRDENSAVSSRQLGSKTPPSERLLAATQSSAAKVASPTARQRRPVPRSPAFIPMNSQSETDSTTPVPGSNWSNRVVRRMISRDKVAKDSESSPTSMTTAGTPTPMSMPTPPLPVPSTEKPLPSRPIASLTSALSPSKDSRTLIDAIEKPLTVSREGIYRDWPALTPRSVSAPERKSRSISRDTKLTPSAIPRRISSSNTATTRISADMVKVLERRTPRNSNASGLTQHSSDPSFVSAEEPMGGEHVRESASISLPSLAPAAHTDSSTPPVATVQPTATYPARMRSLGNRPSNGGLTQPKRISNVGMHPYKVDHSGQGTPQTKSRGHSPSPASFSRPRPGSGINVPRWPSATKDTASTGEKVLHQRTASRIPIPDSKKATLVDIRTLQPTVSNEGSPSFGARRLISPSALAILDQGTKRRLQRANTNGSTASTTSSSTRILNLDLDVAEQRNNRSKSSSPGDTFGASSSDEEEITTPVVQPYGLSNGAGIKQYPAGPAAEDKLGLIPSDLDFRKLRRAPPSKSPFTGPLQTIHSQATLAVPRTDDSPTSKGDRTKFPDFAQRPNNLQAVHQSNDENHDRNTNADMRDAQHALKQLLEDTKYEDARCQQSGKPGLDNETKSHLTQTLSLLEGHGNPAQENFDHGKLEQIFGQLVPGINRASKTNTLMNDAAAAAKFVEGPRESSLSSRSPADGYARAVEETNWPDKIVAELPANETPAISKWSDSTPSAQGNSTELQRKEPERSIGFPSASRAPSVRTPAHLRDSSRRESDVGSRTSSPTLGNAKRDRRSILAQGSVKRGRLAAERGGFARMTASASSKKTQARAAGSIGSAARGQRRPEDTQRGRESFGLPTRTTSVSAVATTKPPRSRSKSRTVLDKINGFFSHKREKKIDEPETPPVPRLDLGKVSSQTVVQTDATGNLFSHLHRTTRTTTPPLTTLPESSSSPPITEQRSSSRATNTSDKSLASILPLDGEYDGKVITLTDKLVIKAKQERSQKRKQRLLNFAQILNDALIHVREAQISAETARTMAEQAELSYLKTQKGVEMLSRLASSLVQNTVRR